MIKEINFQFVKSQDVADFLIEIAEVCERHGFVLEHEDIGGAFVVRNYDQQTIDNWLYAAFDETDKDKKVKSKVEVEEDLSCAPQIGTTEYCDWKLCAITGCDCGNK